MNADGSDCRYCHLGSPVYYLVSHYIDAERYSLFLFFFSSIYFEAVLCLVRLGLGDKLQLACTEKKGRAQAIQVHGASVMLPTGEPSIPFVPSDVVTKDV